MNRSSSSAWTFPLFCCLIFFRLDRPSHGRTPWASVWSSRSLKPGAKKWARTAWCVTPPTHREVLHNAMGYAAANGFAVRGLDFSPVKGPEGNIEYLMFVQKSEEPCVLDDAAAEQVVAASHSTLDR